MQERRFPMSTLAEQINKYAHQYKRHGGKRNRQQQVMRIIKFLDWIEAQGQVNSLNQLGKRHVILYWKHTRDLSKQTRYGYWLAISILWNWIDKPDKPPVPFNNNNNNNNNK